MGPLDYPALFRGADEASRRAQTRYLGLFKADLALLVLGALLTAVSLPDADGLRLLRAGAAVAFTGSLLVTLAMRSRNDEEEWYGGRATAESVKSRTWRYMMAAEPFGPHLSLEEADRLFRDDIAAILRQQDSLGLRLKPTNADGRVQITDTMRVVRDMPLAEKLRAYNDERLVEQCTWYSRHATQNDAAATKFFRLTVAAQAAALVGTIVLIVWPQTPFDYAAVLATGATALISWTQVKKYGELAQVYEVTANELGTVAGQLVHVGTGPELAQFVADAEAAISREHTLWIARRSFRLGRP